MKITSIVILTVLSVLFIRYINNFNFALFVIGCIMITPAVVLIIRNNKK